MIGENIRQARLSQERSLADVAKKAKISVATLSRIENEKQTLELGLFLTLARVLDRTPQDLLGNDDTVSENTLDPLVRKIAAFEAKERTQLWRELALAQRTQRAKSRRLQVNHLASQVEELLAQIDFMREELDNVRKRLRTSR
ncbi:MAG TPA: helix-turn-helix transcriptional regulator [Thermoanaerobaculia bacterium]|nr:helix-turn-helix transcriptional regulator [Thermoanaerobaculia bacterium]